MSIKTLLGVAAFAIAALATSAAQAHAKLESSQPQAGSTLDSAPKEIRLQFNEAIEPAFSKIKLTDASNAEVQLAPAKVDAADAKAMATDLPALRPGDYQVQWTTMTHDGHKAKGQFSFKVK
jgi:methionine-rich copper-binding protein CopC